ncbi:MAG TPA: hypothetical protein PKN32_14790 [Bacteroidales bacterium]|jgi:hypothetical protein|nr:hypothetical protein [Bacteroidales bacterium]
MNAEYKSTIPHLTILAKYAAKHAVAFSGVESNAIVEAMEEYAEQRIREELLKYSAWGYGSDANNPAIIADIDEYLKQRNEKREV